MNMAQVHIKDLQSLLQSILGAELRVVNYTVKDLLPPGENYGSHIVDISVVIEGTAELNNKHLSLVGKLPPVVRTQREMYENAFRKEIFMYSTILPFYRQLEIDSGMKEEETFNISPKFYGGRMSLNPECKFTDDAVILLENMKPKGYYCVNRKIGANLAHAKYALKALARFHALGMAAKEKNPDFFEVIKKNGPCLQLKNPEEFVDIVRQRTKDIAADPEIKEHFDSCIAMVGKDCIQRWIADPAEPWSTIIHADFWTNNIMFHRSDNDSEPDDIIFVDYQNFLFLSPIRELTFFITSGLDYDAINHMNELIDLYYNTLIERLKILNCNSTLYSRASFDERIRDEARIGFPHGLSNIKMMTMSVDADDSHSRDVAHLMEFTDGDEAYTNKLRSFVNAYNRMGWL